MNNKQYTLDGVSSKIELGKNGPTFENNNNLIKFKTNAGDLTNLCVADATQYNQAVTLNQLDSISGYVENTLTEFRYQVTQEIYDNSDRKEPIEKILEDDSELNTTENKVNGKRFIRTNGYITERINNKWETTRPEIGWIVFNKEKKWDEQYTINNTWRSSEPEELVYTNTQEMPENIHDIKAGTTFNNVSYDEMFTKILYPFQYPKFTSFSVSDGPILELGQTLHSARTATFECSNESNIIANSINISNDVSNKNVTDSPMLMINNEIRKTLWNDNTHTFTINGTDTEGNDFHKTYTIKWYMNYFYCSSSLDTLTESDINSICIKVLSNKFNRTYNFNTTGYKYFIYPSDWPTMTTFKDTSTNLDVPMIEMTTINITSQDLTKSYNVHRTSNIMNGNIKIGVS